MSGNPLVTSNLPLQNIPVRSVFANHKSRQRTEDLFAALLVRIEDYNGDPALDRPYRPVTMMRLMHRLGLSQQAKDRFLYMFFQSLEISMVAELDTIDIKAAHAGLVRMADKLNNQLFGPLKASAARNFQTAKAARVPGQGPAGLDPDLAKLRHDCLVRDRHRCVVSRVFDETERAQRMAAHRDAAEDDDGIRFSDMGEDDRFEPLQVAHIIPRVFGFDAAPTPPQSRALEFLQMLDVGVELLVFGRNIDQPTNAITLCAEAHSLFTAFELFLVPVDGQPGTYTVQSVKEDNQFLPGKSIERTLFVSQTVLAPYGRLLEAHAALCIVMHLSKAAEYWDQVVHEANTGIAHPSGSTHVGAITALRLNGWWDGTRARKPRK